MSRLLGFLGPWGAPPDGPAWAALVCAGVALLVAFAPRDLKDVLSRVGTRTFIALCAFAAALLSLGYVAYYLRGGPRIIDATMYFLQGRALSEGHFAWHVPSPTASFRGRFLLMHDAPDRGETLAGIFPPGYPLLLSLGFAVGAPMAVGPALAAAIVIATSALARQLAREARMDAASQDSIARSAAVLSVACAALRYHTADTMAHGACALAFACALLAALRARSERLPWMFLLAGPALGFVLSARFASSLALGAVLAWLAWRSESRGRALVACALGAAPGVALLAVAQLASTGHAFTTTQSAYYATSDGPAGCFRYGFGAGIGCLFEHGDFVRARLGSACGTSFGLLAAIGTTARRLGHHFADVANLGPLALVALVPARRGASPGARASLALVLALVLAYAPFYFDGDYPGGGARFYADVLPVEHALVALGLVQLAARVRLRRPHVQGAFVAVSLVGFSVHMAHAHESLRARDGGHPMFDTDVVAKAHLPSSREHASPSPTLLFVDTDHGFDLGYDPGAFEEGATNLLRVARLRGDDLDRLLYDELGRPSSWVYRYREVPPETVVDLASSTHEATGSVEPWTPGTAWTGGAETWRFESENEWPPVSQEGAWAEPVWAGGGCASPPGAARVLAVHAPAGRPGTVHITLPIPHAGAWLVEPRVLGTAASATIGIDFEGHHVEWTLPAAAFQTASPGNCKDLPTRALPATRQGPAGSPGSTAGAAGEAGEADVTLIVRSGTLSLDRFILRPDPGRPR